MGFFDGYQFNPPSSGILGQLPPWLEQILQQNPGNPLGGATQGAQGGSLPQAQQPQPAPQLRTMPVSLPRDEELNARPQPQPPMQPPQQAPQAPQELGLGDRLRMGLMGLNNPDAPLTYSALRQAGVPHAQALLSAASPQTAQMRQQQSQFEAQQVLEREKLAKPVQLPYGATLVDSKTGQPLNPEGGTLAEQAKTVAEGIISGRQQPTLTGLYRLTPAVRSELEKQGFNLAEATVQWERAKKQIQSLNGPQMTRFVGLANSVDRTIDEVRDLSKQMQLSGIPKLNAVELAVYMQAQGNSPNGQLATRYITAVNTLKEEFANLANGGYAPTEPAWKLANEQINSHYGDKQLDASLTEVQRLIRYRVQAIPGLETIGPGAANRYVPPSGAVVGAPHTEAQPSPAAPSAPLVPSPAAVKALRANPQLIEQFDRKYGPGAAKRALNET